MGGVWGVGSSLAMESDPRRKRAVWSRACCSRAIPTGNLLAAVVPMACCMIHVRLARHVHGGRSCLSHASLDPLCHHGGGAGIAQLFVKAAEKSRPLFQVSGRTLETGDLCHSPDDLLQFLQPRYAGYLSHLPAAPAPSDDRHGQHASASFLNIGAILGCFVFGATQPAFRAAAHRDYLRAACPSW